MLSGGGFEESVGELVVVWIHDQHEFLKSK